MDTWSVVGIVDIPGKGVSLLICQMADFWVTASCFKVQIETKLSQFQSMTEHKFLVLKTEFSHIFGQDFHLTSRVYGSFLICRNNLCEGDWNSRGDVRHGEQAGQG